MKRGHIRMFSKSGFSFAGESITGLVRRRNEDNFLIVASADGKVALAAVADGVGGHRHGEIASYISCRDLGREFMKYPEEVLLEKGGAERFLAETVGTINRHVFNINFHERARHPMSSTLVAVLFIPGAAIMLNVGDSRFYMVRPDGMVEQLSTDHTLANDEEYAHLRSGMTSWEQHTISRSIGTRQALKAEYKRIKLTGGERFCLCTDGVYHDLDDETIKTILSQEDSPKQTVNCLMRSVLLCGAHDNTTVVSVFSK